MDENRRKERKEEEKSESGRRERNKGGETRAANICQRDFEPTGKHFVVD